MFVMKFGGSALNTKRGFDSMLSIMKAKSSGPIAAVISAFSKTTSRLKSSALIAESGNEEGALNILDEIFSYHNSLAREIIENSEMTESLIIELDKTREFLTRLLKGVAITCELTPRTLDIILSRGESMALQIVSILFKSRSFEFEAIDSGDLIITDNNFGNAAPNLELSSNNIKNILLPKLNKCGIILTQGFTAKSISGEITTMGLESSNLTATLIAEYAQAKDIILWTDVPGICTADPKIVTDSKTIPVLGRRQAFSAAQAGLKLIYPSMLDHSDNAGYRIKFKYIFDSSAPCTEICPDGDIIPMIVSRGPVFLHNAEFSSLSEKRQKESEVFQLLMKNCDNELVNSSESEISFISGKQIELDGFTVTGEVSKITAFFDSADKLFKVAGSLNSNVIDAFIDYKALTLKVIVETGSSNDCIRQIHDGL